VIEEHTRGFGQAAHFGRPVIHLQVDVGVEVGVPGRLEVLVPDALQVGRLPTRLSSSRARF